MKWFGSCGSGARDVVRFLKAQGFVEDWQSGSHVTFWYEARHIAVTVRMHTGCDVGRGLAVRILKDAGFSVEISFAFAEFGRCYEEAGRSNHKMARLLGG